MNKTIKSDLYRHSKRSGFLGLLKGLLIPQFRYLFIYRMASKYKNTPIIGIFYRTILLILSRIYGFQIDLRAKIGDGFYIGHIGTIIIGGATVGRNCNIAHNVTLGKDNRYKYDRPPPTIGDRVWIGIGCVIVGDIKIGSDVLISPNTFVNFDIPDNCIVMGNPAKKIQMNSSPVEGYINNILEES